MSNRDFFKLSLLMILVGFIGFGGWLAITDADWRFYYFLILGSFGAFFLLGWLNGNDEE